MGASVKTHCDELLRALQSEGCDNAEALKALSELLLAHDPTLLPYFLPEIITTITGRPADISTKILLSQFLEGTCSANAVPGVVLQCVRGLISLLQDGSTAVVEAALASTSLIVRVSHALSSAQGVNHTARPEVVDLWSEVIRVKEEVVLVASTSNDTEVRVASIKVLEDVLPLLCGQLSTSVPQVAAASKLRTPQTLHFASLAVDEQVQQQRIAAKKLQETMECLEQKYTAVREENRELRVQLRNAKQMARDVQTDATELRRKVKQLEKQLAAEQLKLSYLSRASQAHSPVCSFMSGAADDRVGASGPLADLQVDEVFSPDSVLLGASPKRNLQLAKGSQSGTLRKSSSTESMASKAKLTFSTLRGRPISHPAMQSKPVPTPAPSRSSGALSQQMAAICSI